MGRYLIMAMAIAIYFAFFGTFLYLIGFVGGFEFMPTHVNKGIAASPATAALVDLALIALFGIQHSVMARPGFKAGWTRIIPAPLERSLYCLATVVVLVLIFAFWHPIAGTVWSITNETGRMIMFALFFLGWGVLFISTWLLNHFELFGLQQAWQNMMGTHASPPRMRTPLFYKMVRHPLYTGFFIAFWATPDMTFGHLLFAVAMTIYILIGIAHEERDLVDVFGDDYIAYRRTVGAFIPGIGKKA
ncbi:methanethiol S-methyltransferase [Qipengyuania sp. RANM35]|uniref:methanethiol S-methyltransferase n=1 Tax=Qipengyuania sp. RANM35 TaxID=3068635 RepID=UPI0034DB2454